MGVGSEGMGPLDAADPDCTFQQACIPSEKARIPWNPGNTLGVAPGASGILGWGGWYGVPQGRRLLKEMGE